jgi:hypothetical protein
MPSKRKIPDDSHPDTEDRFNRLLQEMAKPASQKQSEEDQKSDEERDTHVVISQRAVVSGARIVR